MRDTEANRFSARAARYARVGANVGGVAARIAGQRLFGGGAADASNAAVLANALGGLKGPIMKVAQLLATIPDLVPPEYAAELQKLQSEAPPMGAAFVKRRMMSELGADWQSRFGSFDLKPAAAASLGQGHRATAKDGAALACKLQYRDMQSAVEADLKQLDLLFALHRRMDAAIDTREIAKEIGARVREELDYEHEAKNANLYRGVLAADGSLDRPRLGAIVFADEDRRKALNAIVHPLVGARSAELQKAAGPDDIVLHDVPLLAENGLASFYGVVVVVDAAPVTQLDRLVRLRGMTEDEARSRMAAQAGRAERLAVADLVIDNDGPLAHLEPQVRKIWQELLDRSAG